MKKLVHAVKSEGDINISLLFQPNDYLIPVEANIIQTEVNLMERALSLNSVFNNITRAGNQLAEELTRL